MKGYSVLPPPPPNKGKVFRGKARPGIEGGLRASEIERRRAIGEAAAAARRPGETIHQAMMRISGERA